jgi:glyoxylase-like metal-dependent hydrolase (beta-lactamase superfamily II)
VRRVLLGVAALLAAVPLLAAFGLWRAHRAIDALDPALPSPEEAAAALAAVAEADLPLRLAYVNTASQVAPRDAVLDRALDPEPDAPYVMSHPAFVLEWRNGGGLLVDAGMDRAGALRFGPVLEWLYGAPPIRPHGSLAERLGPALAGRSWTILFTHLHQDHTGGTPALCAALPAGGSIRLLQTRAQASLGSYTTRQGRSDLAHSPCLEAGLLAETGLAEVPGLPGVRVLHAAGHTPGSQVVLARVAAADGERKVALVGDVVNAVDGVRRELPKPALYSLLFNPESLPRLARLRAFLRALEGLGFEILPSHDQLHLEARKIPEWHRPV